MSAVGKKSPSNGSSIIPAFVLSNPILHLLEKCKSFSQMKQIQSQMVLTGIIRDGLASSRLVAFCAMSESRDIDYCISILNSIENPNLFSWNFASRGCVDSGKPEVAFVLYKRMLGRGFRPDSYTYPLLLNACVGLGSCDLGLQIHGHVLKFGFDEFVVVHNATIHMFASIGELGLARQVFDESSVRDSVSWNSLINGYVKKGKAKEAMSVYEEMMEEGVKPDEVTMVGVILSCAQLENLKLGRGFHCYIEDNGLRLTVHLTNALLDMYVKCGDLEAARSLFDMSTEKTVVSWTTMIVGYSKCGCLETARKMFDAMPEKNVISWNAMMGIYVQAKSGKEALILFHEMQASDVEPDKVTMVHCLCACSQLGALDTGLWIHRYVEKNQIPLDVALGTALVDMYAKCGNLPKALDVFLKMPGRNSMTWTALICGLAFHGHARDAISYFSKMLDTGLMPDEITFIGVLSACCHGGLVDEGRAYFDQMTSKFSLRPQLKHYSCMVDLLGRAGLLKEALDLIESMPMVADAAVWGALFFACRIHGNICIAETAASKLLELDPSDSGIYVLLATMYREANMFEEGKNVMKMMQERRVEKIPGSSSIEVSGIFYEFIVRDRSHPKTEQIYECLSQLIKQLELADFQYTDAAFC
ncbi:Pentatricopeptide repeat-containing protein At2g22410, mitochondrial [Linum perenne]